MKIYEDITPGLQAILRTWSTGTSACWVSFKVHRDKLQGIKEKWLEEYGTGLSSEKRRYRKNKGLPCAWACAIPVLGIEHQVECILLATSEALNAKEGPFSREKWITRPPEISDFVIVREKKERGDSVWTWKIQNKQLGILEQNLISIIKTSDAKRVAIAANHMVKFYPMFSGVRRQIRRLLHASTKLWVASRKTSFPGPDYRNLPSLIGFKG